MNYDIIIPVAFRDYPFLKKVIYYIENFLDADHIYIITHYDMSCCLPSKVKKNKKCIILDENKIIPDLTSQKVYEYMLKYKFKSPRIGWFLQQFIKMGFALSNYCKNDYYLSWDADTIPLTHIDFFNKEGDPYFSMKYEHNQPYFDTIEKLLHITKINEHSYIAEHMMFNKRIMQEIITEINKNKKIKGETWFDKILYATDPNEESSFSEFETYGNYCFSNYPNLYNERQLPSFRCGGFIQGRFISNRILKNLGLYNLSTISFEIYHIPPFPWSLASWWYNKYTKYFKYKEYVIKKKFNITYYPNQ